MELNIKRNDVCSFLLILTSHTSKIETLSPRFALSQEGGSVSRVNIRDLKIP